MGVKKLGVFVGFLFLIILLLGSVSAKYCDKSCSEGNVIGLDCPVWCILCNCPLLCDDVVIQYCTSGYIDCGACDYTGYCDENAEQLCSYSDGCVNPIGNIFSCSGFYPNTPRDCTRPRDGNDCGYGGICVNDACCYSTYNCDGKECGPDGCGGTCSPGCNLNLGRCSGGQCIPWCLDECSSGQRSCLNNELRRCVTITTDGCSDWGNPSSCTYGCVDGASSCNPAPSTRCSDYYGTCCTGGNTCSGTYTTTDDCFYCCLSGSCVGECTDTSWLPDPSTVCLEISFTQTSNCGNPRTFIGTKDCSNLRCGEGEILCYIDGEHICQIPPCINDPDCDNDLNCEIGENCNCGDCLGLQDSCERGLVCKDGACTLIPECSEGETLCDTDDDGVGDTCREPPCPRNPPCDGDENCESGEGCTCSDCDGEQDDCEAGLVCEGGVCGGGCTDDGDCPNVCVEGVCEECEDDNDCPNVCVDNKCEECEYDNDCDDEECINNNCVGEECEIIMAFWDEDDLSVTESVEVELVVQGNSLCEGEEVSFEVSEDISLGGDRTADIQPENDVFSGGGVGIWATGMWTAEYPEGEEGTLEYYFNAVVLSNSNTLRSEDNLLVTEYSPEECEGTLCSNYIDSVNCSFDPCLAAEEGCSIYDDCDCSWDDGTCKFISSPGGGWGSINYGGTCSYTEESYDDCEDGFLSYSWSVVWTWDHEGEASPIDCYTNLIGCVEQDCVPYDDGDGELYYCDPRGGYERCAPGSNTIQCPAELQLPFFGFYSILSTFIAITLIYGLLYRKKRILKK